MMKTGLFYALPLVSAAIIISLLLRPGMTGMVIGSGAVPGAVPGIRLMTAEDSVLPIGSVMEIAVGNRTYSLKVADFINRSGGPYEVMDGMVRSTGYYGPVFTGKHAYILPLSEVAPGLEEAGERHLPVRVRVIYNGSVLAENETDALIVLAGSRP